jgi:hypothetical protein
MALPDSERIRFLYRAEQGVIDRATWREGAAWLLALLAPASAIAFALAPYTAHDLANSPLWVPMTALAYAYLLAYAFVVFFVAISFVNLCAKRFRARGFRWPLGLAGLAPMFAFFTGAAHFVYVLMPGAVEVLPRWYVYPFDAALAAIVVWTIVELGLEGEG